MIMAKYKVKFRGEATVQAESLRRAMQQLEEEYKNKGVSIVSTTGDKLLW